MREYLFPLEEVAIVSVDAGNFLFGTLYRPAKVTNSSIFRLKNQDSAVSYLIRFYSLISRVISDSLDEPVTIECFNCQVQRRCYNAQF